MPGKIEEYIGNNATAVQAWYGSPLTAILTPEGQWGEPQRMGVVLAYQHVQVRHSSIVFSALLFAG